MADPVRHFFKPLLPGFNSHIEIPLKFFSVHIQGRNERNTVELRSDACERTWKVKLEGRRLTVGWKHFAVAHDFRIGDLIIFRYQGDLVFHVTGFGPSCCEIQYLHSPTNENDDDDKEDMRNLSMEQNLKTEPESDNSCFVAHVTDSNLLEDRLSLPKKFVRSDGLKKGSNKIVLMDERLRTWTLFLKFRKSSSTFNMSTGWRSFCYDNGLLPRDSVTFKLDNSNKNTPILRFSIAESKRVLTKHSSKGNTKTGESSQRVSSSSSLSSLSENRFVTLTVTPASLKSCKLYLPKRFIEVNGLENVGGKKITMLDECGVKWPVYLVIANDNTRMRMRLGLGLREFFEAIDIKAYESFVLELVWEDTTTTPMLKFCSKAKTQL